ncbi:transmembrane amino acid transporter protein-domain-containing protein [Leucosporidium creatinivorum]|uniref:Transmembrane amino acid transporter protein-domain-containing protein n=1 Tax=Leucosporidium creatinivorum TaxID=106004 RepID=A0A1Y2G4G3_9BASI|nr:transmembrane amino acid transporter protein-domain-containing protein [Leucosporidium creatinivorum]
MASERISPEWNEDPSDPDKKELAQAHVKAVDYSSSATTQPSFGTLLYFAAQQRKCEEGGLGSEGALGRDDLADLPADEVERVNARRALRAATWQACFFLVVTDIIGPSSAPWAISQLGFLPGIAVYTVLGVVACYTGLLLWKMYMGLDSDRYPVRGYGDLAEKIVGGWARHTVNILQSVQLIFNVAVVILGNGQSLSQISHGRVCFSVLMLIWTLVGMIVSQLKSLRKISWLGSACVILSLFGIFINVGVVPHSLPNYSGALNQLGVVQGPTITELIHNSGFNGSLVAVMNIVYAYGGALMFVEFMTELRRPMDFWKAMCCAQVFIYVLYVFYGTFIYAFQGQFSMIPANQGISIYWAQTLTNCISLVTGLIVAALYGHVGLRSIYINIVEDLFHGPLLSSRRGMLIWFGAVVGYWSGAFIIASAVPQFSNISGLVASVCILQFSFGIPPALHLCFSLQRDAVVLHPEYDPSAVEPVVTDSWKGVGASEWWKRAVGRQWWLKSMNLTLALAALAAGGLGAYASIESIIAGFASASAATSFTCAGPV